MKKLLFTLLTGLFLSILAPPKPLYAQNCELTAEISCSMQLKATAPVANPLWVAQLMSGSVLIQSAAVQPDGVTFFFTVTLDTGSTYAVQYHDGNSSCGYSTYIGQPAPGKIVTGCTRWNYCNVSYNSCPTTPAVASPAPTETKKKGKTRP